MFMDKNVLKRSLSRVENIAVPSARRFGSFVVMLNLTLSNPFVQFVIIAGISAAVVYIGIFLARRTTPPALLAASEQTGRLPNIGKITAPKKQPKIQKSSATSPVKHLAAISDQRWSVENTPVYVPGQSTFTAAAKKPAPAPVAQTKAAEKLSPVKPLKDGIEVQPRRRRTEKNEEESPGAGFSGRKSPAKGKETSPVGKDRDAPRARDRDTPRGPLTEDEEIARRQREIFAHSNAVRAERAERRNAEGGSPGGRGGRGGRDGRDGRDGERRDGGRGSSSPKVAPSAYVQNLLNSVRTGLPTDKDKERSATTATIADAPARPAGIVIESSSSKGWNTGKPNA